MNRIRLWSPIFLETGQWTSARVVSSLFLIHQTDRASKDLTTACRGIKGTKVRRLPLSPPSSLLDYRPHLLVCVIERKVEVLSMLTSPSATRLEFFQDIVQSRAMPILFYKLARFIYLHTHIARESNDNFSQFLVSRREIKLYCCADRIEFGIKKIEDTRLWHDDSMPRALHTRWCRS